MTVVNPVATNKTIDTHPDVHSSHRMMSGDHQYDAEPSLRFVDEKIAKYETIDVRSVSNHPHLSAPQSVGSSSTAVHSLDKFDGSSTEVVITLLMQKLMANMRESSETLRAAKHLEVVDTLKDAADEHRKGAMYAFAASVVMGAMQIAGGVAMVRSSAQAMSMSNKALQNSKDANLANWYNNQSMAMNNKAMAYNQIMQGGGTVASGGLNYSAELANAAEKEREADAQWMRAEADKLTEFVREMTDMMRSFEGAAGKMIQMRHDGVMHILS